jgi:predicted metalloprotease with PDZ domain
VRWLIACFLAVPLSAQTVTYEISIPSPAALLYHVKAEFPTGGKDTLYVSLPAWSPGAYEIQNYARYVRGFGAKSAAGALLFWDRHDKDTWRVATGKSERVAVEFDYLADTIDLSLARIARDYGQFLGTNLFLYQEGQLQRPAEVRFTLPPGWQVTTALKGSGSGPYTASDYHELADAQTFVGKYSLDSLRVDAEWIRLAVWPADAYTAAVARNLRTAVEKITRAQNLLMGGPACGTYTIFFSVIREPIGFGGGLEHSCAHYDILPQAAFADSQGTLGDFVIPLMSHEFFHRWNVKRIRPAELWPYDYHGEQYTPLLWWSEGVTDYYADLTNLRSGLWTADQFLASAGGNMEQVESAPEPWSEEDGSVATWINEVYVNSSQLYYPKGSVTGLLLDISIRDATNNAKSLDDVTRALFTRFYQKGRGFTTSDLLGLLREVGMPDVEGFYQRHINGREPLPYDPVLTKAGIAVIRETVSTPFLGVNAPQNEQGQWIIAGVVPGSAADRAGLQGGDVLVKVGDVEVSSDAAWAPEYRNRYRGKAGQPLTIVVRRDGQTLSLNTTVQERTTTAFRLSLSRSPGPKQARIWRGLATGSAGG